MKTNHDIRMVLRTILLVTLVILALEFVFSGFEVSVFTKWQHWATVLLYVTVLTLANTFYFYFLNKNFSWKRNSKKQFVYGIGGSVAVSMIAYFLCRLVHVVYIDQRFSINGFLEQEEPGNYLVVFLLVLIVSLFIHVAYYYKHQQETEIKEQKIIAGTASAKFDALKNQLDPHFLFNSLNVLTALIEENPDYAQKFTTSLSKVYRYVLEQKSKELVSVEEELRFAETYIGLLEMRFENSIEFEFSDKINNPEAKIVPLSLQLLLENAVKHNRISEEKPLNITIFEHNGNLVVKNNLQPKNVLKKSHGIGLSNIHQRYGLLTARKVEVNKTDRFFEVKLPILTKQISNLEQEKADKMKNLEYQKMKRAKKQVDKIKGFYGNLTSYVIIIPFLAFVNYFSTGFEFPWVLFPLIGWGIGLFFHYMDTFGHSLFFGKNWEERKIKEFMEND